VNKRVYVVLEGRSRIVNCPSYVDQIEYLEPQDGFNTWAAGSMPERKRLPILQGSVYLGEGEYVLHTAGIPPTENLLDVIPYNDVLRLIGEL
jgi:hypothetical protein